MKVAPVSADLLVKLALGLAVAGVVWYGYQRARQAAADAANLIPNLVPWNSENAIYQGVNGLGGAIVTDPEGAGKNADGSWTLGGWVYDVTHPETAAAVRNIGAAEGGW